MKYQSKLPPVSIDPAVFLRYPNLRVGLIHARGIDNKLHLDQAHHLLADIARYTHRAFHPDNLKSHNLISPWAVAQQEFGAQARHYQTGVEVLLNNVLRGRSVCANDTATELARYLSLQKLVPISTEDPARISGQIKYSLANGHEKRNLLLKLLPGTLYHRDSKRILGTHLDYWKPKQVLPTKKSNSILIHIPILPPVTPAKLQTILKEFEDLLIEFCGGRYNTAIVSKTQPHAKWK